MLPSWTTNAQYTKLHLTKHGFIVGAADLLDGQLQQLRQAGSQRPHQEGGGRAADVQHAGRKHWDEGVLPDEGVEQRQHCMATPRQHAEGTEDMLVSYTATARWGDGRYAS